MALIESWQQQAGRVLTRARPVGALLAVPAAGATVAFLTGRGGYALAGLVPVAVVAVLAGRELARLDARGWLRACGSALIVCAVAGFWAAAVGPRLLGYETMTVLSTSMSPTFNPGDVIVVTRQPAASVRAGQIISFHIPTGDHHVVTHRIATVVSVDGRPVIQTKGDANTTADPWTARLDGTSVWRYRLRLPLLGYPLLRLREPLVRAACLYGAPLLLLLLVLGQMWLPKRITGWRPLRHAQL